MAGKSKHKKGKHIQSKKGKSRQRSTVTRIQQPAVIKTPESPAQPVASAPSRAKSPPAGARPTAAQYTHITTELRTIGILAGIMLVALVVLSLVLP